MAGLAPLLHALAQAGVSVHVHQGRLGVAPQEALPRFAPLLKQHKTRLLELAAGAGGTLPPEHLAGLAQELAEPQAALGPDFARPKRLAPDGCPVHWLRVPELPKCWQDAPLQDEDGFGRLYRLQVRGVWYLLKFLPPFDGRVSITDVNGKVRVLAGVAEALALLDALATKPEAV